MTQSMVERVARAMCAPFDPDETTYLGGYKVRWTTRVDDARTAIEAMRDPGIDILDAMNDVAIDGPDYVSFYPSFNDCNELFNAAIDTILNENGGDE